MPARALNDLRWPIGIAAAIVAAFAAVVITTVDDRAEIAADFRSSFHDQVLASTDVDPATSLRSDCEDLEPRLYRCTVTISGRSEARSVYDVTLKDSGCWTARLEPGKEDTVLVPRMHACIGGGG